MDSWKDNNFIYDVDSDEVLRLCGLTKANMEEEDGNVDSSGEFRSRARNMFFGSFWPGVREAVIKRDGGICRGCGKVVKKGEESIDHKVAVSAWFNRTGYLKTREKRDEWYNDIANLQLMHADCNSSKGGERFEPKKVAHALGIG